MNGLREKRVVRASHRRIPFAWFLASGLSLALVAAFFISPLANSSPDGLERVAIDENFAVTGTSHPLESGPLSDYGVRGVDDEGLSTGLAGIIGVGITFTVAAGAVVVIRQMARRSATTPLRP